MRKLYTKLEKQEDGSVLEFTVAVGRAINRRILKESLGIQEERFVNQELEIELILGKPKMYVCNSTAIRQLAQAQPKEKVFVIKQLHTERSI